MSAPTYIVQNGDILSVPTSGLDPITIEWPQSFLDKKASYHTGFVDVKGKGVNSQVLLFIQSEWYQDDARMASITSKTGDYYELKIDEKSRYGQKNSKGEARFIVYHDTSRNPYQHRFINQALRSNVLGGGQKVAQMLGVSGNIVDMGAQQIQCFTGDPLRHF
ncbi:hypothetical protein FRC07_006915 [Ceratobasidium sp. 392]|nr:hypothetical protein FRC07_006915 [Ceratobasidium sp. 392]